MNWRVIGQTFFLAAAGGVLFFVLSVPLAWTGDGLPIGMHFVGRLGAEEMLFSLAAQLEQARPWRERRPPLLA